ncbi:hypothetical protein GCM10007140_03580 [Priestia taiwanensis]|uniref:DUF5590 domain-containing protein n=2 Tax=Priestia taiwanensis TaxID=1347902 RepID=A0A917AK52_9BACI|nr:hypothetical protein GCM10007140_03580 [Priestia taiwanensis]
MYYYIMNSKIPNETEALNRAKQEANITEVYSTNYYHGTCAKERENCSGETNAYTVFIGADNEDAEVIVFIPEEGGEAVSVKKDEGITEEKALSLVTAHDDVAEMKSIRLGIDVHNRPIWEFTFVDTRGLLTYRQVIFKTGELSSRYALPK